MSASDWHRTLDHLGELGDLYETLPPLNLCDPFYVHFDEREESATVGFTTTVEPSAPPPGWLENAVNTVEFYLLFTGVAEARVFGWGPAQAQHAGLAVKDGRVLATLGNPGTGVEFRARSVHVSKTRVYKAAVSP
ncbi:immunity 50 family protein [Streptomyces olivaceus]|uniref:immunity 50 family protein n=1 Tax=Streptomyces TaxID=1883 RepID=UPI0021D9E6CB|nr:immunity 50 family protein [Streptomyces sp. A13(2022)]MCU8589970.1 immunity 50 family protein [Streptomyces sp. A13(2022)]